MNRIVVWDPSGQYWEGSLIERSVEQVLSARGACVMPVAPELFNRGGNAGFVKRAWGAGYPLAVGQPKIHCPTTMLVFRDYRTIHWRARLVCNAEFDAKREKNEFRPGGMLRLIGDGSRELTHHMNVQSAQPAVDLRELPAKDAQNGWIVGGRAAIDAPLDGHFGFALYGEGEGVRVAWLALTLTKDGL